MKTAYIGQNVVYAGREWVVVTVYDKDDCLHDMCTIKADGPAQYCVPISKLTRSYKRGNA